MGNGKVAPPDDVDKFCRAVVGECLDGGMGDYQMFALGFAACLDAVARGTIDLSEDARDVVGQALIDVNNVTTDKNRVTDLMRTWGGL